MKLKYILYFPMYILKTFFRNLYNGMKDILRPSNLSYIILLLSLLAWYNKLISLFWLVIIVVFIYAWMEWVSGDFKKEIKEKEDDK